MSRCPITYDDCEGRYSARGLRLLSPSLQDLEDLPYSASEQIREAAARAGKMSIQGTQPKLSAVLSPTARSFLLVDTGGRFILKPQHPAYPELPENEDLTMRLAALAGIEVPLHGLLHCSDGSLTYFVRRFDRKGHREKLALEDFAQLSGRSRDTKYDSTMESVAKLVQTYATFPAVENPKLFLRTLFCFLTGNEDMHLKNFSLLTTQGITSLSPAYDLLNTTLVLPKNAEEVALPLRGKRRRLKRLDWLDYWALERLALPPKVLERTLAQLASALPAMLSLIDRSFLSPELRTKYKEILLSRAEVMGVE